MKKLFYFIAMAFCVSVFAAELPKYIVTGPNPTDTEKIAAEELQRFFKQIYGRELIKENGKSPAIYLGATDFALKNGADYKTADEEEWIVKTIGNDLVITGGRAAGTLYGVYAVLEKLGVRFLAADTTVVPKAPKTFPSFSEKKKPSFKGRLIYDSLDSALRNQKAKKSASDSFFMWKLRIRQNGRGAKRCEPFYVGSFYNFSIMPPYHSLSFYVSPDLYKTHPEYFQMDAFGKRVKPRSFLVGGCVCMSNKDVRRITLESLRAMIKKDRASKPKEKWPKYYDISTLDDSPYICKCPECMKITKYEGSETGLLLDYINYVATEIKKEYPEIIIRTFGYSASKTPPKKIMPADNVLIQLCDSHSHSDCFKPLEKNLNTRPVKNLLGWFNSKCNIMMWDYWNIVNTIPPRVETVYDAIKPDLKLFLKNNVQGVFMEAEMNAIAPQTFMRICYYTCSRLLFDISLDEEELANEFIEGYYGSKGAPVIKKYFNITRKAIREDKQHANSMSAGHRKFTTPAFMYSLYSDYKKAISESEPLYAKHLKSELISPVWAMLANWNSYEDYFKARGITKQQLIDECKQLVSDNIRRFECSKPEYYEKRFSKAFESIMTVVKRPEKFKNVPDKNFRMITYKAFRGVASLGTASAKDPESEYGFALKSSSKNQGMHAVNKKLPGKYNYYTTEFVLANHRERGAARTRLKSVAQDEKYHWYRIPGSIEIKTNPYFWGQGWAIQARVSEWYLLTDGNPLDNTWEQVWFRAKFTGPAYVSGSKKENAIYIDAVVITRGEKDNEFISLNKELNTAFAGKDKTGLPDGWSQSNKKAGAAKVIAQNGKNKIAIAQSSEPSFVKSRIIQIGENDVIKLRIKASNVKGQRAGVYFFNKDGISGKALFDIPFNDLPSEFIITPDMAKKAGTDRCYVVLHAAPGNQEIVFEDLDVSVARNLNVFQDKK